jgi:hypothetical protein
MFASKNKEPKKGKRSQSATKLNKSANKAGKDKTAEELQHEQNMEIAGGMIKLVMTDLRETGVHNALIELLKTVRHWPSAIDEAEPLTFIPQFDASDISAEATVEDGVTITRVSFTYKGKKYDFVSTIENSDVADNSNGNITLHECGDQVVDMKIIQNKELDHLGFQDLQFINFGPWIEKIVQIETEIKQHHDSLSEKPDVDSA